MTEEELKNVEQATNLIVENGFVIKNTDSFIRAIDNTKLEDIINRLNALSASVSEGINVSDFVNKITEKLNSIEELTNNDPYFKNSISANDFQNLVTNMRGKFTLSKNCSKALEILKERKENLKSVNKRIKELEIDTLIDDVTRTSETVKLSIALNNAKNAAQEAEEFYNEQKKLYNESLKTFDVVKYRNELLKAINALDDSYRKLSMEPATMDKMATLIRDTRDEIVVFGFEAQKSQKEFDELCKKFGLEKTDAKVETKQKVEEPTPMVEQQKPEEPKPQPQTKPTITTVEELAKEMKLLNSHLEISTDEKGFINGIIYDGESKLVLPKEFNYDKMIGINNKVDDKTPYICLPVKTKEKVKTEEPIPTVEPPKAEQPVQTEPKKGTRHKVKKIRRAVVAPYVSSTICFTALATLVGGLAGSSLIIPIAALGAGVGAVGQAIYNKMAAAGIIDKENENARENNSDFEEKNWGLAAVDNLITRGKDLFNKLKFAKERKNSEPAVKQPVKPEEPKPTLTNEPKEETLENPDNNMNFEDVFNQKINSIFADVDEEIATRRAASENNQTLPNISGEEYNIEPEQSLGGR